MAEIKEPFAQKIAGNWKQFTGKLKETWGELSDDELAERRGRRDQLEGYIEEKTGDSRQKIRKRIDEIADAIQERV